MPQKCYYRAGKDRKGKMESCAAVVGRDKYREVFLDKLQNDETFRNVKLRWTKHTVEEYVAEYKGKAACPGPNMKSPDEKMCSNLYLMGELLQKGPKKSKVKMEGGNEGEFDNAQVGPYDEMHDGPVDDLPDDVCCIPAFGEAALLKVMRRRLVEKLSIYTYVGDIILCMNPYMMLPEMCDIDEYPNQKNYVVGEEPIAYASAHFAYWNQRNPNCKPFRNQSCIVSGESGAGKTVSCGNIMKYLAKLSNWRKLELGEEVGGSQGPNITALVAGVSPFLEAFGNAKTNMNDNSSRFGKFTKIWFNDGKIVGAELVHYLLEKARLNAQGSGERNYHVFYFLIRGATDAERTEFKLKTCDDYPKLCEGGSSCIGHGLGPEYDEGRFNRPLHDDPDDTGTRAALTAANISDEQQHDIWTTVAACLRMAAINFVKEGDTGANVADDSKDDAADVAAMLGVGDEFGEYLTIDRMHTPDGDIDKPCNPSKSVDNRNALSKDIYGNIFAWLILGVCNGVLEPKGEKEAFVGLLDIFGFEVMPKNSIEQLCINFANEKLQQLFNQHVFDDEEKAYVSEGLPTDMIPPHNDNTPCCNLVVKKTKKFMGLFPLLDDKSKSEKSTDEQLVGQWNKSFGKKKGLNEKAKDPITRAASQFYFGDRKKDYIFTVVHFAGSVTYNALEFLAKNKDKLPSQLTAMMQKTSKDFIQLIGYKKEEKKKKKKKGGNTLASKYTGQLKSLADTLTTTNPWYVRCVKPNDIHFRPVDGMGAFNYWKTYRQLLYAGVMEVVKIKKEGYPFREAYEVFWKDRCVKNNYHMVLGLSPDTDPIEGAKAIAEDALRKPIMVKNPADGSERKVFFYAWGKTLFFGKDTTPDELRAWHQRTVAGSVQAWWRYWNYHAKYQDFRWSVQKLTMQWKAVLNKRKYAAMEKSVVLAQSMVRTIKDYQNYKWRQAERLRKIAKAAAIKAATELVQKNYRNLRQYKLWYEAYKGLVHTGAVAELNELTQYYVDAAKNKLASSMMGMKIKAKFVQRRQRVRAQARIRGFLARKDLSHRLKLLAMEKNASFKAEGLWRMESRRQRLLAGVRISVNLQKHVRRRIWQTAYKKAQAAVHVIQRWIRKQKSRIFVMAKKQACNRVQQFWRFWHLRSWYNKFASAAKVIEKFFWGILVKTRFDNWFMEMDSAAKLGNAEKIGELLALSPPYDCLGHIPKSMLVNMRDKAYFTSFLHSAAKSGNLETVRILIGHNGKVDVSDLVGDTPLHNSVALGDKALNVSQYMLDHSFNKKHLLSRQNKAGQYPFDVALECDQEKEKTVVWLMENGASVSPEALTQLDQEVHEREEQMEVTKLQEARLEEGEAREQQLDIGWQQLMLSLPDTNTQDNFTMRMRVTKEMRAIAVIQKFSRRMLRGHGGFHGQTAAPVEQVGDWKEHLSDSGAVYFYNTETGHTSWDLPPGHKQLADGTVVSKYHHNAKVSRLAAEQSEAEQGLQAVQGQLTAEKEKERALANELALLEQKLLQLSPQKAEALGVSPGASRATAQPHTNGTALAPQQAAVRPADPPAVMKRKLLHALMAYDAISTTPGKAVDSDGWFYYDGASQVHGPYDGATMGTWHGNGAFHPAQPVARSATGHFASIEELYPAGSATKEFLVDSRGSLGEAQQTLKLAVAAKGK